MTRLDSVSRRLAVCLAVSALVTTAVCFSLNDRWTERRPTRSDAAKANELQFEFAEIQAPHVGNVISAEFTPDSNFLVTWSDVGEVIVWDAQTGRKIKDVLPATQPNRYSHHQSSAFKTYYGLANGTDLIVGQRSPIGSPEYSAWLEFVPLREVLTSDSPKVTRKFVLAEAPAPYRAGLPRFVSLSSDGRFLVAQDSSSPGFQAWDIETQERVWDASKHMPLSDKESVTIYRKFSKEPWYLGNSSGAFTRLKLYASIRPDGHPLYWPGEVYVGGEGTENSFGPHGRRYVTTDWSDTGSSDEDVVLWDVATREPIRKTSRPYSDPQHIQFTSDGQRYLERGDKPSAMDLRDAATAELIHSFLHAADLTARAMSPDDRTCVAATADGRVHVWDLESGKRIAETYVGKVNVVRLTYRPDSQQCLVSTSDGITVSLDLPNGRPAVRFVNEDEGEPTNGIASYSPDGTRVVIRSRHNECTQASLWDAETGDRLQLLATPPVHDIVLSPNGRWSLSVPWKESLEMKDSRRPRDPWGKIRCKEVVLDGSVVTVIRLRNTSTGEVLHEFRNEGPYYITSSRIDFRIGWRTDNRYSRVVRRDGVKSSLWKLLAQWKSRRQEFWFPPDQRDVITEIPGLDDTGREWLLGMVEPELAAADRPAAKFRWLTKYPNKQGEMVYRSRAGGLNSNSTVVVALREDVSVKPGAVLDGEEIDFEFNDAATPTLREADYKRAFRATAAALSSDQSELLVAYSPTQTNSKRTVMLWDTIAKRRVKTFDLTGVVESKGWHIRTMHFSPGNDLAVIGFDYHTYLLNLTNGDVTELEGLRTFYGLPSNEVIADFSPNGDRIIGLGREKTLWDASNGKKVADLKADDINVGPLFGPEGKFVLSYSGRALHLWDAETGVKLGLENKGYHGGLFECSIDGTRFVGPRVHEEQEGFRAHLALWDFKSGKQLAILFEKEESPDVRDALFSPDGSRLVTTHKNHLKVWDAASGKLLGMAESESEFELKSNGRRPIFLKNDLLITAHHDRAALWDIKAVKLVHSFPATRQYRLFVRPFDDDRKLLVVSPGLSGTVWDLESGRRLSTLTDIPADIPYGENNVWLSEDETQVFARYRLGEAITAWDVATGAKTRRHLLLDYGRGWVTETPTKK